MMERYKIKLFKGFIESKKVTEFVVEVDDVLLAQWIGRATATMLGDGDRDETFFYTVTDCNGMVGDETV